MTLEKTKQKYNMETNCGNCRAVEYVDEKVPIHTGFLGVGETFRTYTTTYCKKTLNAYGLKVNCQLVRKEDEECSVFEPREINKMQLIYECRGCAKKQYGIEIENFDGQMGVCDNCNERMIAIADSSTFGSGK